MRNFNTKSIENSYEEYKKLGFTCSTVKLLEDKTDRIYPLSIQDETDVQNKENIYARCAKCLWYNTRNELQSEFINLELLTEL